ncbi:LamG-like jellyroll fold domain-containing protein [Actinoalloteichus hymeniacidonis]|uniref:Metallophosphoesterase n=1 Tax=Actinoalloteichus hymeniacidonis TaxID=340345 RepID=A0AAC9HNJ0_9PSEU|nr:LamG-like jellyroll fold domain-containing protein [Actinoalloteichus hymeniacidonis]AOS62031.1 metallophosphoesterase [Actinoalloteichus hymeniacidonis]MBB5909947.1 3',5'-cyclic AMP phosphodiesterase CpdA [Actinoalloteichus hymeniacidonis]
MDDPRRTDRDPAEAAASPAEATQAAGGPALGRRTLLHAAAAVPVIGAAASLPAVTAPAAHAQDEASTASAGRGADLESTRFVIAVLPDTQYLFDEDSSDPTPLRDAFRHVVDRRREEDIVFLAHLGDVTEHGSQHEIDLAERAFRFLDRKLPYSVLAGNHDVDGSTDDQRGDSPYLAAFGPDRFRRSSTYLGSSPGGYNSAHVLRAGDRDWLLLALDWRISDTGLDWARGVLAEHPTLPTILTTHDLAFASDDGIAQLSEHGRRLWDGLINDHDQIFLTLNGHYWPSGRTVLQNAAGNDVHVHIANYQDMYYGGAATLRYYSFDLVRGVIDVETFSPWLLGIDREDRSPLEAENVERTGEVDRFSVAIDFEKRFAGFSGVTPPAARPADEVVGRGTVAYWRFDESGLGETGADGNAVNEGTVARDLTGNGNDLVATRLHNGPADVLTFSADHHVDQPAHASLRFDGAKDPNRGALLRAVTEAPINSMTFESGYTIELFAKLPDPMVGDHSFMGLLSWEGRAGDAGKTSGWSQDEPTCSLNLSGERFLQYVVYPNDRDADPTSWSHALPMGRWMHLAVVNDGRQTVVYVDGSKIARNPTQRSKGITTLGKPFVIGGTQFAEEYSHGFYGWIGDVRISSRALRTTEFLTTRR